MDDLKFLMEIWVALSKQDFAHLLKQGSLWKLQYLRGPSEEPSDQSATFCRSTAAASDADLRPESKRVAVEARIEVQESLEAIRNLIVLGHQPARVTLVCSGNTPTCVGNGDGEGEADGGHEEGKSLSHLNR